MEDKTFDLLTQMYSDFSKRLDQIEHKLDQKADKSDIIRLENDHGKKLDTLFDGYKQVSEGLNEIKNIVSEISAKVERHDIKIQVIEGGKKATN